jgi:hypothetical protein
VVRLSEKGPSATATARPRVRPARERGGARSHFHQFCVKL